MTIYANRANERKATSAAFKAYRHVKEYLEQNYDNLTSEELDNMIHNVELLGEIVECAPMELIGQLDQNQIESRINYMTENGYYPKL